MLRSILSCGIVLGLLLAPVPSTAGQTPAKVSVAFLPESDYEFPPVLEGTEVVHEFVLKNKGEAPLNILQVKSG